MAVLVLMNLMVFIGIYVNDCFEHFDGFVGIHSVHGFSGFDAFDGYRFMCFDVQTVLMVMIMVFNVPMCFVIQDCSNGSDGFQDSHGFYGF